LMRGKSKRLMASSLSQLRFCMGMCGHYDGTTP
jgi:hypothetical protein